MSDKRDELLLRIAHLARENQALGEALRKLQKSNEELNNEVFHLKELVDQYRNTAVDGRPHGEKVMKAAKFAMSTVLYSNIHFGPLLSDNVNAISQSDDLDNILTEFDSLTRAYKVKKIRTIGDSFMCAGGIPVRNITNPVEVVMAALEMRNYVDAWSPAAEGLESHRLHFRCGIHTGPVTAYISGRKLNTYDLKGDTVNIASRIETVARDRMILISVMTFELVKEFFDCEYYGRLPVKYKGDLELFEVRGLRPAYSINGKGLIRNEAFDVKLKLIQFTDIQELVLDKLQNELSPLLFYHSVKHTVDVVTEAELIGWAEGCNDEEILLLKTAALFHDTGHTVSYDNHEYEGTLIAASMLPDFGYSKQQIETVCRLIMATRLPPDPSDHLESIICDSDLDYLGRSDFIPVSNTLFEELKAHNKMKSLNDWNKIQIKFISGHQYFTRTARRLREVNKQLQIERLKSLIND